jgi:acetylornithine deacetylase/succinyl-diaminopimelate desuccinylase-like protein
MSVARLVPTLNIHDSVSTDSGSISSSASSINSDSAPDPDSGGEYDDADCTHTRKPYLQDLGFRRNAGPKVDLKTNTERLWDAIHHTAQWGAIPDSTGMARLALSDEDKLVRDYFVREAITLGCEVSIDEMGNIFAVLPGENNTIPPVGMGSHLDTQPAGKAPLDQRFPL